jgi:hypothetical protein
MFQKYKRDKLNHDRKLCKNLSIRLIPMGSVGDRWKIKKSQKLKKDEGARAKNAVV